MLVKSTFECIEEFAAKDDTEYFDGQKELVSAANPSAMIWGEPTSWDHTMEMGMMPECLTPSLFLLLFIRFSYSMSAEMRPWEMRTPGRH